MRIASFVPSATEILFALGLGDQVVGVTHECEYPPEAAGKPRLINTVIDAARLTSRQIDDAVREAIRARRSLYQVDIEALRYARPDLLITQSLCQVCAVDTALMTQALEALPRKPEVLSLHPHGLEDIFGDVARIGERTGRSDEAVRFVAGLRRRLERVRAQVAGLPAAPASGVPGAAQAGRPAPGAFCLEWLEPLMACGHWVPEQVAWAGARELIGRAGEPSRVVTAEEITVAAPEAVFIMPCGLSPARAQAELPRLVETSWWQELPAVRAGRVFLVDGPAYFNQSGPRVVDGVELLAGLLHPDCCEFSSLTAGVLPATLAKSEGRR